MGDIIASQVKAQNWILAMRAFILFIVFVTLIGSTIYYLIAEH